MKNKYSDFSIDRLEEICFDLQFENTRHLGSHDFALFDAYKTEIRKIKEEIQKRKALHDTKNQ